MRKNTMSSENDDTPTRPSATGDRHPLPLRKPYQTPKCIKLDIDPLMGNKITSGVETNLGASNFETFIIGPD